MEIIYAIARDAIARRRVINFQATGFRRASRQAHRTSSKVNGWARAECTLAENTSRILCLATFSGLVGKIKEKKIFYKNEEKGGEELARHIIRHIFLVQTKIRTAMKVRETFSRFHDFEFMLKLSSLVVL